LAAIVWQYFHAWLVSVRPIHALPYIVALQMALFINFIHQLNILFYLAGNVAVVAAVLFPITVQRPKYHWVR